MPDICPRCGNSQIKFLGTGTQKLEEEAKKLFPEARILRWDSDTTRETSHEDIMRAFVSHQADIMIGTQMITKGLDIPNITVVGVINADIALNFPHFLATERTFQLLSQVAGRAGRGSKSGRVILQTYNPMNFAIQAAAKHDYSLFFEQESIFRRQLGYPPFQRMAGLVFSHTNDNACQKEAERFKKELEIESQGRGIAGLRIIGPAPAFIHRLRGIYRWQIVLCGPDPSLLLSQIPLPRGWALDIDPMGIV
jgi:primosomal protein N' (replication factor Y)